jgi:KTSC domain
MSLSVSIFPSLSTPSYIGSSVIAKAEYSRSSRVLDITFTSGARYRYIDVSPKIYRQFSKASSKGSFFNSVIKPGHTCYKLVQQI